ncbi:S-acyltransferase 7 [Spatholobus suberectus]|nr:S-acyltransferase 7 [Spatholobus suberectus]
MYVVPPPQRSDPGSGSGDLLVYQAWKGSNKFFLQGRFIFGPDVRSLALTVILIVAPVAVFCVFVGRKLMDDFSDHWGISIMAVAVVFTVYALVLLLLTSGRDPGIIPRNAHPPEPEGLVLILMLVLVRLLNCGCLALRRLKSMASLLRSSIVILACCTGLLDVPTARSVITV